MSPKYRFITFRHDRLSTLILETDWSERTSFFELRRKVRAEAGKVCPELVKNYLHRRAEVYQENKEFDDRTNPEHHEELKH